MASVHHNCVGACRGTNWTQVQFTRNATFCNYPHPCLVTVRRSLFEGHHSVVQLSNSLPYPPLDLFCNLLVLSIHDGFVRLLELIERFPRGGAVIGGIYSVGLGLFGCDFKFVLGGRIAV